VFLIGSAIVVASSALFSTVAGYGTQLFQAIVLGAWLLVASVTSTSFADQHAGVVYWVAAILNVVLFGAPAFGIFTTLRDRTPKLCIALLGAWVVLYLACLFVLFPATDGP